SRGQAELGADEPLAALDSARAGGDLDPVGVVEHQARVGVRQAGHRRPVPDRRGQEIDAGADHVGRLRAVADETGSTHAGASASAAAIWMIWSSWPPTSFWRP